MKEAVAALFEATIYQERIPVLQAVTFRIEPSEFVYLVGKTGSGKSSLLKVLYGDLPLTEGSGYVVGYDLRRLRRRDVPYLRRRLGIVFQDFELLTDRTVEDNLQFVLKATGWKDKRQRQQRIAEVLEMVGLGGKGFKLPHQLSAGEQQRVVIARALLNRPELILADEPTGNLDPETSEEIIRLLLDICRSSHTAVLLATHDYLVLKKFPSRLLRCVDGRVVSGQIEELVS
ncbi:MAG: ATP-binding cassette domain-containing protein [Chitinophagales bacterium]|nr:ATP-binding cassette domain-containing protein [Chitinophagales bacterium]MDW8427744.1 ATP-binding cassette domain-containing protein [Chitinophagales bacterium]